MIKKFKLYKIELFGGNNDNIFNEIDNIINNIKNDNIKNQLKEIIDNYKKSNKSLNEKLDESNKIIKNILDDLTKLVNKLNEKNIQSLPYIGQVNQQITTKPKQQISSMTLGNIINRR